MAAFLLFDFVQRQLQVNTLKQEKTQSGTQMPSGDGAAVIDSSTLDCLSGERKEMREEGMSTFQTSRAPHLRIRYEIQDFRFTIPCKQDRAGYGKIGARITAFIMGS